MVQETFITALCWLGVALLLSSGLRAKAPQWRILNGLLCFTVLMKTFFTALQFGGELSLIWLTAGALWGMVLGSISLRWALRLRQKAKFWLALFCLITATIVINQLPDNPYFIMNLRHWHQGRLVHFNELMQWVSVVWLPVALIWMIQNNAAEMKSKH